MKKFPKETATAQVKSKNQGTKKYNLNFKDLNLLRPEVAQDLLYVPREDDKVVNIAWTYTGGNRRVRFQNCLDGKTIRWFVDGREMPQFEYPKGTDLSFIATTLRSVCESVQ